MENCKPVSTPWKDISDDPNCEPMSITLYKCAIRSEFDGDQAVAMQ